MEDKLEALKEQIENEFQEKFYKKLENDEEGRKKFCESLNLLLHNVCTDLPIVLEPVKVKDEGNGVVSVDIMRAFKNYPIASQLNIACELAGIDRKLVDSFQVDPMEGYITEIQLFSNVDCRVIIKAEE